MLNIKEKRKIIEKTRTHETDSGSAEVQVGILTEEIGQLTKHLKKHPKDNHSRRGLLGMVSKRKQMLSYLEETNEKRYGNLIRKLGLKK